jgi:hypothetical protein
MTKWIVVKRVDAPRWPRTQAALEKALNEHVELSSGQRRALARVGLATATDDGQPGKTEKAKPARSRQSKTTNSGSPSKPGRSKAKPNRARQRVTAEERFTRSLASDTGGGAAGLIADFGDGRARRVGGGRTI